ncbi:hypothetical protein O3M35_002698 [Rhynocoris fuscipes]|uniref:Sperm microtubule inner protein 1 C-terminal domain-containing protein n=1 Tax=Rhynocoris fuscipes TaxID=488301 RepID=A0AAW1CMF7_9HEMI
MNARKEKVLKEAEEKARRIRLNWFEKYHSLLKSPKEDEFDVEMSPVIANIMNEVTKMRKERYTKEREVMAQIRAEKAAKRKGVEDDRPKIDEEILRKGPMLPVDREIAKKLYQGTSGNGEGRWLYLKLRSHAAPYHKYYEPMTEAQVFGWKIEDRAWPANKQFGKQNVIKPQFYRRTGVKGETLRNRQPASGLVDLPSLS